MSRTCSRFRSTGLGRVLGPAMLLVAACAAPVALVACDLLPALSGSRAFPTPTALGGSKVRGDTAGNSRGSGVAPGAPGRSGAGATIPPLLTRTPTPTPTETPGTPLPSDTPTKTLTPFATPTRYPTATRIPAPPTVTPRQGAPPPAPPSAPAAPTSTAPPAPPGPGNEPTLTPPPGPAPPPPALLEVGEPAGRDGMVFIVTRVDRTTKRMDVIYRVTNQTGSAISVKMLNADQRLISGSSIKDPADPGGAANVTLQNGQSYDSGTTFNINTTDPEVEEVIFGIDNLPRIGGVRVRIPLRGQ